MMECNRYIVLFTSRGRNHITLLQLSQEFFSYIYYQKKILQITILTKNRV